MGTREKVLSSPLHHELTLGSSLNEHHRWGHGMFSKETKKKA